MGYVPPAPQYLFRGSTPVGAGVLGLGSTAGMNIGTDVQFTPSIFMITKGVRETVKGIKSVREPMKRAIRDVMSPSIKLNFSRGGRPKKWLPLAPDTIKIRQREGFNGSGPVLIRTRKLRNAAIAQARWKIDGIRGQALYGNFPARAKYGPIHQIGVRKDAGSIPARPFAVIQEQDMDEIKKVFADWLMERAERKIPRSRVF